MASGDKVLGPNGDQPEVILRQFLEIMREHGNPLAISLAIPSKGPAPWWYMGGIMGRKRYDYKGKGWQVGRTASNGPEAAQHAIWLTTEGRLFVGGTADWMDVELQLSTAFRLGGLDKHGHDPDTTSAAESIPEHIEKILRAQEIPWRGPPELWILTDPKPWQESWRFSPIEVVPGPLAPGETPGR
jgi:hypothetical protein